MSPDRNRISPGTVLAVVATVAALSIIAFMTLGVKGNWGFALPFRATKVAAMILVAYTIAVSTILFQTATANRILTPSIMGFDALYALIQTCFVFFIGSARLSQINPQFLFVFEVAAMVLFSGLLYRKLFSGSLGSLHLMMLAGIVFGILFRSLSGFLQRIIDPNEFVVLQDRLFANFNTIDQNLLMIAAAIVAIVTLVGWRLLRSLDVLALGREPAINLGINHARIVTVILALVAILVSVSTALVGPVTFFGLLVASLAYQIVPSHRHLFILPAAVLLGVICLVGGQVILERMFAFDTALSIIIEFAGGLVFIFLLVRGSAR